MNKFGNIETQRVRQVICIFWPLFIPTSSSSSSSSYFWIFCTFWPLFVSTSSSSYFWIFYIFWPLFVFKIAHAHLPGRREISLLSRFSKTKAAHSRFSKTNAVNSRNVQNKGSFWRQTRKQRNEAKSDSPKRRQRIILTDTLFCSQTWEYQNMIIQWWCWWCCWWWWWWWY